MRIERQKAAIYIMFILNKKTDIVILTKTKKANFLQILQEKSKNKKRLCINNKAKDNKHAKTPALISKV
eukprot:2863554-Heterocapsa_arctica.AAC.1